MSNNILLDKSFKYVDDVLNNKEITTWEVKKQCEIIKDDLINQQDKDFYFDEKQVSKINNLLKLLNFATGFVAGKRVLDSLSNFQAFLICNLFGWRYKDKPYKFKFNDITLYIARKNAKTALVAVIFILLMLTEQKYSEFYSICLSKELASEIRKSIVQILEASPLILDHFKISKTFTGKIECKLTHSFFQPRVAEANKNNSIRPSAFVSDEHAIFSDKSNFNAMKSGQKNVLNPLVFRTTTAYAESNSIIIDELSYIRSVLNGDINNDRQLALVYYAEKEHLWDDIGILQANPLRIEENYNTIREDREKAKIIENEQEEYLTKSMNVMLESNEENKYINMEFWKKCRVDSIDFSGREVVVGVDLSVTTDLTAVSIMFREGNNIYCKSHGFKPSIDNKNRREDIDYKSMQRKGYCDIHEGMTVNYSKVEEYIRGIESKYNCTIKYIVSDPMNAKEMMERLAEDYDVILLKQTFANLSPATKEFRKKVYDGEVFYEKNKLLDWNMTNAVTVKGKSDDEMLSKENKNKQRIDMVAVLIFAFTQLLVEPYDLNAEILSDDFIV